MTIWQEPEGSIGALLIFEMDRGVFQGVTAFTPLKKGAPDLKYMEKQRQGLLAALQEEIRRPGRPLPGLLAPPAGWSPR